MSIRVDDEAAFRSCRIMTKSPQVTGKLHGGYISYLILLQQNRNVSEIDFVIPVTYNVIAIDFQRMIRCVFVHLCPWLAHKLILKFHL